MLPDLTTLAFGSTETVPEKGRATRVGFVAPIALAAMSSGANTQVRLAIDLRVWEAMAQR